MKVTYSIDESNRSGYGGQYNTIYNPDTDKVELSYRGWSDYLPRDEIEVETEKVLTGRWKVVYNKVDKTSKFTVEVKCIHTWKTIKKPYVKVIKEPKVWYTTRFFFFNFRHTDGGELEKVPQEIIQHTRDELIWLNENDFIFREVMEDSDYETTIHECG